MPELPEVERGRRLVETVAAGRRIEAVSCAADEIVFSEQGPAEVRRALVNRRVTSVARRGKYLWLELEPGPCLLVHFGMTGSFRSPTLPPLSLASDPESSDGGWPPSATKIRLFLEDGGQLALRNPRRLGRIRLRQRPLAEPPVSELGFDPFLDLPDRERFAELVSRRRAIVKGLLLDQSFAAGVGNWIADEVLYQARIDPRRRATSLDRQEIDRLRRVLHEVITTAVEVDADSDRFPAHWLFHRRWGKREDTTTSDGAPVDHIRVAGRTTAWVPSVQA